MKRSPGSLDRFGRFFLVFIFLSTIFFSAASAAFRNLQEGMTVPEVKGRDILNGESVSWKPGDGGAKTGVTLIVFWATWSPRSLELLGELKGMTEKYKDYNFNIIAINVDGQGSDPMTLQRVTSQAEQIAPPFPMILDEQLKLFNSYGVIAVPSVAAVDGSGVLRYGPAGYSNTVKDRLIDSTEVLLEIRTEGPEKVLVEGYRPNLKADRYYNLGRQLAGKGLYKQAIDNLERASAADPRFSSPHNLQGQIKLTLGEFEDAERSFARAVELDSTSVAARTGWGKVFLVQGMIDEAMEQLSAARDLDETYTPALWGLAECYHAKGKNELAWPLYEAALELNPRDPELLFSLGKYFQDGGDSAAALEAFQGALEQLVTLPIIKGKPEE